MKLLALLYLGIMCSCSPINKEQISKLKGTFDFDLLVGDWERTNDSGDRKTYESWWIDEAETPRGIGYTLVKNDTVWKEHMVIKMFKSKLSFIVEGKNDGITPFEIVKQSSTSFKCNNPNNEFPNDIEYIVGENKIKATISGGGEEIDFLFNRLVD